MSKENTPHVEDTASSNPTPDSEPVSFAGKISRRKLLIGGGAAAAGLILATDKVISSAQGKVETILTPRPLEQQEAWLEEITLDKEHNQGPIAVHSMPDGRKRIFYLDHVDDPIDGWQRPLYTVDFHPDSNSPARDAGVETSEGPLLLDPEHPYASVQFLPDGRCMILANLASPTPRVGLYEVDMETNTATLIQTHNTGGKRYGMTAMTLVNSQLHYVVKSDASNAPELWKLKPDNTTEKIASMKGSGQSIEGAAFIANSGRVALASRPDGSDSLTISFIDPLDPLNPSKNTQFFLDGVSPNSVDMASIPLGSYYPGVKDRGAIISLVLTNSANGNPDQGNPAIVAFSPDGDPTGFYITNVLCQRHYPNTLKDKTTNCFPPRSNEQDKWGALVGDIYGNVQEVRINSSADPTSLIKVARCSEYPQPDGLAGPAPVRLPSDEDGEIATTKRSPYNTNLTFNRQPGAPPTLTPSPTPMETPTPEVTPPPTETHPVELTATNTNTPVPPTATNTNTPIPAPTDTASPTQTPEPTSTPETYDIFVPLVVVKFNYTTAEGEAITGYELRTSK